MVSDSELKVAVLGLGYIGLPTAAVIARTGAKVLGVDVPVPEAVAPAPPDPGED